MLASFVVVKLLESVPATVDTLVEYSDGVNFVSTGVSSTDDPVIKPTVTCSSGAVSETRTTVADAITVDTIGVFWGELEGSVKNVLCCISRIPYLLEKSRVR